MTAPAAALPRPVTTRLLGVFLAGAAVAVGLGVYGKVHDPTGEQPYTLFFTATINLKVWFATVAVALAVVQIVLAARLYGKIDLPWPREAPAWLGDAHRLTGTLAFLVSLPVAYHCLWALGFQSTDTRVLLHSLLGCFFYGVFTTKVLSVRHHGMPGWLLPVVGGLTFAALVGVWLTSSLWFMTSRPSGLPLF
ncbi:MAG: DUF6529 family protein [Acidimicrobiia bacterium]